MILMFFFFDAKIKRRRLLDNNFDLNPLFCVLQQRRRSSVRPVSNQFIFDCGTHPVCLGYPATFVEISPFYQHYQYYPPIVTKGTQPSRVSTNILRGYPPIFTKGAHPCWSEISWNMVRTLLK